MRYVFLLLSVPSLLSSFFFFFNDTATTEIYTLSLHDALPIYPGVAIASPRRRRVLIRTTEPLQRPQHRRASAAEFADCYCVNPVRSRLESFSMRLSFSITSFGSRPRFTRLMSAGTEAERSASSLASC